MLRLALFVASLLTTAFSFAFPVEVTIVHATCGASNGSIWATVIGVGPFTYTWTPAPGTGQGTPIISDLAPGTWTITVNDMNGGSGTATATVLDMPNLDVSTALLQTSSFARPCPGMCNGQLTLNTTLLGGDAPYVISTIPAMPLNALCGNMPFDVVVTDANGCTGTATMSIPEVDYPVLIGTILNGPCPGAPTSVEAFFDPPSWSGFSVMGPGGAPYGPTVGPHGGRAVVFPAPSGVYTFIYQPFPPCPSVTYPVTFPGAMASCSDVDGTVFVDVNGNCVQDGSDYPLAQKIITISPGGYTAMTDFLGHYQMQVPYGTYDLSYTDPVYTQICPVASPVNFTLDAGTPAITVDIPLSPSDPDVSVACGITQAVPGFNQTNTIVVTNNSATPTGPLTVTLDHDAILNNLNYNGGWCGGGGFYYVPWNYPNSYTPTSAQWDLPDGLGPFESATLLINLGLPPDPLLIGTVLDYTATAVTVLNDIDPSNNTCLHSETVVGSFDPNDKTARTTNGSSTSFSLEQDSSITYTIRFQNTGTAPAVNIVLTDTLAEVLDLATLRILGASHTYAVSLDQERILRFTFDHILLPDSGTNEFASHGFAQFSIHPVGSLLPGALINNEADIFFDFNPAIHTNTSSLLVETPTGLRPETSADTKIHPVPVADHLWVTVRQPGVWMGAIVASDGRMIRTIPGISDGVYVVDLAPGTYLLRLSDPNGTVQHLRFVKQ